MLQHSRHPAVIVSQSYWRAALRGARQPRVLALLFCCQALFAVVVLAMLVPTFENSDEFNHMKRADQIASGHFVARRYGGPTTSGGRIDLGIERVDAIFSAIRFHPELKVSPVMLRQAGAIRWGQRGDSTFANTAQYAPFLYAPAAIGVWAGKHAGFSITSTLVIARVLTGVASVVAASAAIAFAGEAAPFLLVLLTLPMSLSIMAAVSQDGPMLAAAAIAMALLSRARSAEMSALPATAAALAATLALMAMGRPAYAPLALVPLLLPRLDWRLRAAACGAALAPVAAWCVLTVSVTSINTELWRGVDPAAQLAGLARHPGLIWELAAHALWAPQGPIFYREFVGILGWLDVDLPDWFYGFAGVTLLMAALVTLSRAEPIVTASARVTLFLLLALAVAFVFLLVYLTWTPVGRPIVEGVQGRYFLPLAIFVPAIMPALHERRLDLICDPVRLGLLFFPAISIFVTITSVVHRYYI